MVNGAKIPDFVYYLVVVAGLVVVVTTELEHFMFSIAHRYIDDNTNHINVTVEKVMRFCYYYYYGQQRHCHVH